MLFLFSAYAATFHVDPVNGSSSGDGSASAPWATLASVVVANKIESQQWSAVPYSGSSYLVPSNVGAPVGPGDTILLYSGDHGAVVFNQMYNASPITIRAAQGHTPVMSGLTVRGGSGWVFDGFTVRGVGTGPLVQVVDHMAFHGPAHDITLQNLTVENTTNTAGWSDADWSSARDGIWVTGSNVQVQYNTVRNVHHGIQIVGDYGTVHENQISWFSGDAMRGLGDYGTFTDNTVREPLAVDQNHDDGFQSWSVGANGVVGAGEVRGLVITGNHFIHFDNPGRSRRGNFQGIGCFDGFFVDFVIENNVIEVDSPHGITLTGARNGRIVNNTIRDPDTSNVWNPAIMVRDHKNGTPSSGMIVRNNLTKMVQFDTGVTESNNILYTNDSDHFVDPAGHDLHLRASSSAIDAGTTANAPGYDKDRWPRPEGGGVDVGAYEYSAGGGNPPPPGGSSGGSGCAVQGAPAGWSAILLVLPALVRRRL